MSERGREHNEHVDESRAMYLVALRADDPERRAAVVHTEHCAACGALWQESLQLLTLLDREGEDTHALHTHALSDELVQRVQTAVSRAQASSKPLFMRVSTWLFAAFALCSLGLFWSRLGEAPRPEVVPALHDDGWGCLRFELGFGVAAFVLGLFGARIVARELGVAGSALAAMSGALVGQWLLGSRCESEQTALHLLLFHVSGVALAAVLGALAGELKTSRASA
jgi:hypothetical protein